MHLGPIVFRDYEIPTSVRFGGRHRVAVRTLSGGDRAVERLGPDDSEIQFDGVFSGSEAENRAMTFDNLRLSGQMIWLGWQSFRRLVLVKSFIAEYHSPWWITYQASCIVVRQTVLADGIGSLLIGTLWSDLGSAQALGLRTGVSLAALQMALSGNNVATPGTVNRQLALDAVRTTLGSLATQVDTQSSLVSAACPVDRSVSSLSAYIAGVAGAAGALASAAATRSYVSRIGVTLNG
jgi:hypothetical protein